MPCSARVSACFAAPSLLIHFSCREYLGHSFLLPYTVPLKVGRRLKIRAYFTFSPIQVAASSIAFSGVAKCPPGTSTNCLFTVSGKAL